MKRFWLAGLLATLAIFAIPAAASAHELQVDGNISAVMHVEPDDSAVADTPTQYILFFNDDAGKFSLATCDCTATVMEQNKILSVSLLAATSNGISNNTFTFPRPDVYTMTFSGTPKTPDAFQPFKLTYEVRVANGPSNSQTLPPPVWIAVGLAMLTILVIAYILHR